MYSPGDDRPEDCVRGHVYIYRVESKSPISTPQLFASMISRGSRGCLVASRRLCFFFISNKITVSIEDQTLPALFGSCGDPPPEVCFLAPQTVSLRNFHHPVRSNMRPQIQETRPFMMSDKLT